MSNLTETATYELGVYQLETTDPVLGGPDGIDNLQAKQLANRTKYLKEHVDALEDGTLVPSGIATEDYVQNLLEQRGFKQTVRVATTGDITLSGTQTIDGVSVTTGNRVLVKNQTDASKNGIYVVSATAWTRALDANESEDVTAGMVVVVSEGTLQADTIWKLTTNDTITLGTTLLTFADITAGYAPLASPAFTGNPSAPTAAPGDADTTLATTEFVMKATDGMATVSVAGGDDVTLTAAQHGLAILSLTGIITANINLIFPSASGQWVVANNSSGAFNITAKTAAGTGVVVPQGYAIVLYGDGTNIYAASAAGQAFVTEQTITGVTGSTLTVPGGYTAGALFLEKNGARLTAGVDYTATNGSTISLTTAAVSTDVFVTTKFSSFEVANAVQKSGDTMAGPLVLAGDPTAALEAATKQYVDNNGGASIQGSFKNLQASATGTNANISVSADEIAVENSSNAYKTLRAVSLTINSAAIGANGLDTGAIAASTWYSVWVIWNDTTAAGLLSLSATAPTMPSGYTHKARVGWMRTDGTANKYPLSFIQAGRKVRYKVASGSNLAAIPTMASGAAGSASTPTWASVAIGNYIPSTAKQINIALRVSNSAAMVAGNDSFGSYTNTANLPPLANDSPVAPIIQGDILVESANIYWASTSAAGVLSCLGWEDNL